MRALWFLCSTSVLLAGIPQACSNGASPPKKAARPPAVLSPAPQTPETPPSPPVPQIRLARENGAVVIHWRANPNAVSHNLYFGNETPVDRNDSRIEGVVSPFRHSGLTNGNRIYYRLEELGPGGARLAEEDFSIIVDEEPTLVHLAPDLFGVAYGKGRFVAAGSMGAIFTSPNGRDFERLDWMGARVGLNDIIFKNDRFVAVGDEGVIAYSADGSHWTDIVGGPTTDLLRIRDGGDRLLAFDRSGNVYSSADGLAWKVVSSLPPLPLADVSSSGDATIFGGGAGLVMKGSWGGGWKQVDLGTAFPIQALVYGFGRFLGSSPMLPELRVSLDGESWTTGAPVSFREMAFDGERFWGLNELLRSSNDGTTWSDGWLSHTIDVQAILVEDGRYFVAGAPRIGWSTDLRNWTFSNAMGNDRTEKVMALAVGGDRMVAIGNRSIYHATRAGSFVDWEKHEILLESSLLSVAYGNGRFIAGGGSGTLLVAEDPTNWTRVNLGNSSTVFRRVIFHQNRFVVITIDGAILTSPDGGAWTVKRPASGVSLCSVFGHGGATYALACTGSVFRSSDLQNWEPWGQMPSTWPMTRSVTHDGEKFIIAGSDGLLVTTPDFKNFTRRGAYLPFNLRAVVWDATHSRLLIGGESGYLGSHPRY